MLITQLQSLSGTVGMGVTASVGVTAVIVGITIVSVGITVFDVGICCQCSYHY